MNGVKLRIYLVVVGVLVLVLCSSSSAWAISLHAGNTRSRGYGVKTDISTPVSAPYVDISGQSSWVSTAGPVYWVQTGWRYYVGYSGAKSYYEYKLPTGYKLQELSVQAWNFTRNYCVTQLTDGSWQVKINGDPKGQWYSSLLPGPQEPVRAESESHLSTVQLNTQFNNVQYRGTTTWFNFDENAWEIESPYWVSATNTYRFHTYGP